MNGTGEYYAEWSKSIREGQSLYGFTHMGNIKNSERDYRGKERKWVGNISQGDSTQETPNSGKWTRGGERGGGQGDGVTGWRALTGAPDRMSTGYYTICWQSKLQLKKKQKKYREEFKWITAIRENWRKNMVWANSWRKGYHFQRQSRAWRGGQVHTK